MIGNHLDLGRLQRLQVCLQPPVGLLLAENGLAEEVDIHAHALGVPPAEVLQEQFRLGRQNDVGRLLAHLLLDQRHGHARRVAAEGLEALQQRPLERAEEARNALHVEDVDELVDGALGSVGAECLVGDLDQRRLVLRMVQHAVELGLLAAFGRSLQFGGTLLQPRGDEQCLLQSVRKSRGGVWTKVGKHRFTS